MKYDLTGKWYVIYSNFPMWIKGDKKNPFFYYGKPVNGKFSDTVEYYRHGKRKTIEGTDVITDNGFIWRGKGLLKIIKSRWEILDYYPEHKIAIIHFHKTFFTPQGFDVISRKKEINLQIEKEIFTRLECLGIKNKMVKIQ
ncbi:MAG: hypothetical protein LUG18_06180 [Candidatus Azobacteroides sp.]|nr:hypothetical protein [Candidatus Azobacteroides sp.]